MGPHHACPLHRYMNKVGKDAPKYWTGFISRQCSESGWNVVEGSFKETFIRHQMSLASPTVLTQEKNDDKSQRDKGEKAGN